MRGRDSSPFLVILGPVLSAKGGHRIGEGRGHLSLVQQTRGSTHFPTVTCNPDIQVQLYSAVQTRYRPVLLSATTGKGQDQLFCSHNIRVWPPTCCGWKVGGRVGRHISLIHASDWKMRGRTSSPVLTPSGPAHPHLPHPRPVPLCFLRDMQAALPCTATN